MERSEWETIRHRLAAALGARREGGGLRRAAVLVPLYQADGETFLLLTRRTQMVEHHKGQIAFPGGAADEGEDLLQTALRETYEEIGISPEQVEILGRLPDTEVTVSGFRVTPYVGAIPHPYPFRLNAEEIKDLVSVPLAAFRDPANLRVEQREWTPGRRTKVYYYTYEGQTIWGATARIIKDLVDGLA